MTLRSVYAHTCIVLLVLSAVPGKAIRETQTNSEVFADGALINAGDASSEGTVSKTKAAGLCQSNPIEAEDGASTPTGASTPQKVVALFADYDGCWDLPVAVMENDYYGNPSLLENQISRVKAFADSEGATLLHADEGNQTGRSSVLNVNTKFMEFVTDVTKDADRTILFVGSNRQNDAIEALNEKSNGNGNSMAELKKFADAKGWEFNNARLDQKYGAAWVDNLFDRGSKPVKKAMAENNIAQLTGPTDVYFFDDSKPYLDATLRDANIPRCIDFHTVHFDGFGLILGDRGAEEQLTIRDVKNR